MKDIEYSDVVQGEDLKISPHHDPSFGLKFEQNKNVIILGRAVLDQIPRWIQRWDRP